MVSGHATLMMCAYAVIRNGVLVRLIGEEDRNDLFMAMVETPLPPQVHEPRPVNLPRPKSDSAPPRHQRTAADPWTEDFWKTDIATALDLVGFSEGRLYFESLGVEIFHGLMYLEVQEFHDVPELARRQLLDLRATVMTMERGLEARRASAEVTQARDDANDVLLDTGASELVRTPPSSRCTGDQHLAETLVSSCFVAPRPKKLNFPALGCRAQASRKWRLSGLRCPPAQALGVRFFRIIHLHPKLSS